MPCFDQPDIKASLNLTVHAPAHYEVIANEKMKSCTSFESLPHISNGKTWVFWPTKRISTYLYALCAGPFFIRTCSGKVDYRVMCRKSFEKYLTESYAHEFFAI